MSSLELGLILHWLLRASYAIRRLTKDYSYGLMNRTPKWCRQCAFGGTECGHFRWIASITMKSLIFQTPSFLTRTPSSKSDVAASDFRYCH
jgi:hypothetical protein